MKVRFSIDGPVARENPQIIAYVKKSGFKYIEWCDLWMD